MMLAEQPSPHQGSALAGFADAASFSPLAGDQFGGSASGPLFQRLDPGTDHFTDFQELQRHAEAYRQRAADFERMNADLEHRLERQGNQRMQLEAALAEAQRGHARAMEDKERELTEQQQRLEQLQVQNHRLRDNLHRTERELVGVLAKKYEIVETAKREARKQILEEEAIKRDLHRLRQRADGQAAAEVDAERPGARGVGMTPMASQGPREIRTRLAADSLGEFFGLE